MNFCPSTCDIKEDIRRRAIELGACRCGFAQAEAVDAPAIALYDEWIAAGRHGEMEYCAKYKAERNDPRMLHEGAQTIVSCAFSYNSGRHPLGLVARYALGMDYHLAVRDRLTQLGEYACGKYGGTYRVLVDSAPMRERYWAQRAGIGFVGINNQLIIPGEGSYHVLGELLWTVTVDADSPLRQSCKGCQACAKACPTGALDGRGGCDASKCLSYLTVEKKELPEEVMLKSGVQCAVGCDICQEACPHNAGARQTQIAEFAPRDAIMRLDSAAVEQMGSGAYKRLVARSALRRLPLKKLKANLGLIGKNLK